MCLLLLIWRALPMKIKVFAERRPAWTSAILLVLALFQGGVASGAEIAADFELPYRTNGQPFHLRDYAGQIILLEFFVHYCECCQLSTPKVHTGIVEYYRTRGGNRDGIPVTVIYINILDDESFPADRAATDEFIRTNHCDIVANDYFLDVYTQFRGDGTPFLVLINGVTNSTTHQAWQVLYTNRNNPNCIPDTWINSLRTAIDAVEGNPFGRLMFSLANYSASETGGVARFTVTRTGGSLGTVSVDFATANGTATAGSDYVSTMGPISLSDGVTSTDFTFQVLNDAVFEGNETVLMSLRNPTGGAQLGAVSNAVMTIVDNEFPTTAGMLQFSLASYTVLESGRNATITVTRTGGSTGTVSVDFATAGGSATASSDYTATNGTLFLSNGVVSRTFTVPINNDTADETNETVALILSNPTSGASLGARNTATLTITDEDIAGNVAFSAATFSVNETGLLARVIVTRTGGAASGVTVDLATADGTATAGVDYGSVLTTLTFSANEIRKTNLINIVNDALPEGNETVLVSLRNAGGGARLGAISNAVLTIVDDEVTLQFSSLSYTNSELGPVANITVARTGGPITPAVSVDFATVAGGTATPGPDFAGTNGTLTLGPNVISRAFAVRLVNDALDETNETVHLQLSNPGNALLGARTSAVLHIVDNDDGGRLAFGAATFAVTELGPSASVIVTRSGGLASNVTVRLATTDGSATNGEDYTGNTNVLAFTAGELRKTINIPINNDTLDETNETVLLALSDPTGGAALGLQTNAVLTINDNDMAGKLAFSAATFSVSETGTVARVIVSRTLGAASGVTVDLATADGTATAGADYAGVLTTLTFNANETRKTNLIAILNDPLAEGNETVNLTLRNATGMAMLGAMSNAVLTIVDDEVSLQFRSAVFTNSEAGPVATITVVRGGPATGTVGVGFATSAGTATVGQDYAETNGTLTFGPGITSRTFTVRLINDTVVEGNETVNLSLINPTGGALLGNIANAVLDIVENDAGGAIQFSAAAFTVTEAGPNASILVTRTGGAASGVTVDLTTVDGTATAGADYTNVSRTLTFGAGELSKTVLVPIINDSFDEVNETVALVLSNPTGGGTLGPRSGATLTITDNDVSGSLFFSAATYSITEGGGFINITVNRAGGAAAGVTVEFSTSDGTATDGADYTGNAGSLTFNAGETAKTFAVPILQDTTGEGNETVHLRLRNPSAGATLGLRTNAVLTILDDEIPVVGTFKVSGSITDSLCDDPADNGTVALYAPPASGLAPAMAAGASVNFNVTSGTGVFAGSGSYRVEFDEQGRGFQMTLFPSGLMQEGVYIYTKTGLNTATLILVNTSFLEFTTSTTVTFKSAPAAHSRGRKRSCHPSGCCLSAEEVSLLSSVAPTSRFANPRSVRRRLV
jgi:hypothetical protein